MNLVITDYRADDRLLWNAFVTRSKNATFLFLRDYMDYHADRFQDVSLIATDERGDVRALLPATRTGDEVCVHAGLGYGGFLTDSRMTVETMLHLFDASLDRFRKAGATWLVYKTVPRIYHRGPADEDLYALFVRGAELFRREVLSVLDYASSEDWEDRRLLRARKAAKAVRAGIEIRGSNEYDRFWSMLTANLERRHGVRPVHSLEEIELLAGRFPERIRLFGAYRGGTMEAGEVVYVTDTVCHSQYAATSPAGRDLCAHDLLLAHIVDEFRDRVRYFDFGISSEQEGRILNNGLLEFKERFGARAVVHDFYRVSLADS